MPPLIRSEYPGINDYGLDLGRGRLGAPVKRLRALPHYMAEVQS
jgi:hypothetical protein